MKVSEIVRMLEDLREELQVAKANKDFALAKEINDKIIALERHLGYD